MDCLDDSDGFSPIIARAARDGNPSVSEILAAVYESLGPNCASILAQHDIRISRPIFGDIRGGNLVHALARVGSPSSINAIGVLLAKSRDALQALEAQNAFGQTPLHEAAILGNIAAVEVMLLSANIVPVLSIKDAFGSTPLSVAIIENYPSIVQALVSPPVKPFAADVLGRMLRLACELDRADIVAVLLETNADVHLTDSLGETAAHVAARSGHCNILSQLLSTKFKWNAQNSAGQTPLIVAETQVDVKDRSGLNAYDHAILHGEMAIADILSEHFPPPPSTPSPPIPDSDRTVSIAYGQPTLHDEALVQVYFGSSDTRIERMSLEVDQESHVASGGPYVLTVWIQSLSSVTPHSYTVPLPDQHSSSNLPITFRVADPDDAVLHFEINQTFVDLEARDDSTTATRTVATAHTQLMAPKTPLWREKTGTCGRLILPLFSHPLVNGSPHSLAVGSLLIELVIATPLAHDAASITDPAYRRWEAADTKIVGHRGLGANRPPVQGRSYLQMGENTIESFIKAGEFGAEFVEFDVQLTSDSVPVLYHNFITTESGLDAPVNAIRLEKFLSMHEKARHPPSRSRSVERLSTWKSPPSIYTPEGKIKPNSYGSVQSPFPTLEEVFKSVPDHTGFNIEVKYPNVQEAEKYHLDHPDINLFCDAILSVVLDHAYGTRAIYFSSFHPEICLLLCQKQNKYPVFFLTEGGMAQTVDERLNSLWSAIQVAKRCGCLGIVTLVDPLLKSPALIPTIRRTGLLLFTYGSLSNDVDNCKIQRAYGVDGIIVDKVRHIVLGLYGQNA
eukprot:jgi/Hompol1/7109/HPOL_000652-RA